MKSLLPIVERELRVAAREPKAYWGRLIAPGVMLLFLTFLLLVLEVLAGTPFLGNMVFRFLTYAAFSMVVFGGAMRTADAISREKREGTLGLLFLTDLRGYDIVLGKLFAAGIDVVLGLLGTIPVLATALLLGGVSGTEIVRTALGLLNALFLALAIGIAVSTGSLIQRKAQSGAAIVMIVLVGLVPGACEWLRDKEFYAIPFVLELFSPLFVQNMASSTGVKLSAERFWLGLGIQFLLSVLALAAASQIVEHTWKIRPATARWERWQKRFELWAYGPSEERVGFRQRLLNQNAFFWLVARNRLGRYMAPLVVTVGFCVGTGIILYWEQSRREALGTLLATVLLLDLFLKTRVATFSAQRLADDRLSGALEPILATPVSIREIIKGHWMGLRRNFMPTVVFIWICEVVLMTIFLRLLVEDRPNDQERKTMSLVLGTFFIVSVGDMLSLPWIAMWKAMRLRHANQGVGLALTRVLILPWVLYALALAFLDKWTLTRDWWESQPPLANAILGLTIWGLSVPRSAIACRYRLVRQFRVAAADRYMLRLSLLDRLLLRAGLGSQP